MKVAWLAALPFMLLAMAAPVPAADSGMDRQTRQRLGAVEAAVGELVSDRVDPSAQHRTGRGERLNQAFVLLTGEAVNPLFGVTALGMYRYFSTPEHLREGLPLYDQPVVWGPLLFLLLVMLFNSTLCEAFPFLKVPLNAIGDLVNKAGAAAVLPLVVTLFANQVAPAAAHELTALHGALFSSAHAAVAGTASPFWHHLGWLAGALAGTVIYGAVWLSSNVIDVLILICPFPGIDALLKSFRLAVVGLLLGTAHYAPTAGIFLALAVFIPSLFLAGWSFRLSTFGLVYSSDLLFFRKNAVDAAGCGAFSSTGLLRSHAIPMRTWGSLRREASGELVFSYRPWLILGEREVAMTANPESFAAGRGLLNPFLVPVDDCDTPWLRLPPRYRAQEEALRQSFCLTGIVNCGMGATLKSWMAGLLRGKATAV